MTWLAAGSPTPPKVRLMKSCLSIASVSAMRKF